LFQILSRDRFRTYQRILLKLMTKKCGQKNNEDVKGATFSFSLPLADDHYNLNIGSLSFRLC
jgi:hypothetical protein